MKGYDHLEYSLAHLSDAALDAGCPRVMGHERHATAVVLAYIGEYDERKRYAAAGYSSMFAWCMGELHLCEQATYKRILAARTARRFPAIFHAVAEGRLHLTAVVLLAPHLTEASVDDLLAAATHKSKAQIEKLLADRTPKPDLPVRIEAIPPATPAATRDAAQLSPGIVGLNGSGGAAEATPGDQPPAPEAPTRRAQLSPGIVEAPVDRPRLVPLGLQRFGLQLTIDQTTYDDLRRAQALLGHQVPSGDVAAVLGRALKALITELEKRKFAATENPRSTNPARTSQNPRYIPAHVRRAVRQRDGDQCTFVSTTGRRCSATARLEFDHVSEVARGGQASAGNVRLRCRAHNQYTAECTFGAGFMDQKRRAAAEMRRPAKSRADEAAQAG